MSSSDRAKCCWTLLAGEPSSPSRCLSNQDLFCGGQNTSGIKQQSVDTKLTSEGHFGFDLL